MRAVLLEYGDSFIAKLEQAKSSSSKEEDRTSNSVGQESERISLADASSDVIIKNLAKLNVSELSGFEKQLAKAARDAEREELMIAEQASIEEVLIVTTRLSMPYIIYTIPDLRHLFLPLSYPTVTSLTPLSVTGGVEEADDGGQWRDSTCGDRCLLCPINYQLSTINNLQSTTYYLPPYCLLLTTSPRPLYLLRTLSPD